MLDGLMPEAMLQALHPSAVSPGMLALVADNAPTRTILCAGAGSFEQAHITMTRGIYAGLNQEAAETIAANWSSISDRTDEIVPASGSAQGQIELEKAGFNTNTHQGA